MRPPTGGGGGGGGAVLVPALGRAGGAGGKEGRVLMGGVGGGTAVLDTLRVGSLGTAAEELVDAADGGGGGAWRIESVSVIGGGSLPVHPSAAEAAFPAPWPKKSRINPSLFRISDSETPMLPS